MAREAQQQNCLYHFQTCISIKNHQKESSQGICASNQETYHTQERISSGSILTQDIFVTINHPLKHHNHLPKQRKAKESNKSEYQWSERQVYKLNQVHKSRETCKTVQKTQQKLPRKQKI